MTIRNLAVLLSVMSFFPLDGCAHSANRSPEIRNPSCGELLLGNPCATGRCRENSRWKLWTGIAVDGAALVAAGLGTANLLLADQKRASARNATAMGERAFFLDQAERHDRLAAWSFGVGAPLAVVGLGFIIADVVEASRIRPFEPKKERAATSVIPAYTGDGGLALSILHRF